jgi:hypothetical protein
VAQKLKEPGVRRLRREPAVPDLVEQLAELQPVHLGKSLTGVDFGLN